MSTNRMQPERGWCNPSELPKGPNGRNLCRRCGQECPKSTQTFCGKTCVHEWKLRTQPAYARRQVFERDKGICAICGIDVFAKQGLQYLSDRYKARGFGDLWHADHVVPVVEGGGECGIDNLRTLCVPCHKAETAVLRKRLAAAKRPMSLFGDGVTL